MTAGVNQQLHDKIVQAIPTDKNIWKKPKNANQMLSRSSIVYQLIGKHPKLGTQMSGAETQAISSAEKAYKELNKAVSGKGDASDQPINRTIAMALKEVLDENKFKVDVEIDHPWLPDIRPDVMITTPEKIICLEMHYTSDERPFVIADYVLKKMDRYMKQFEKYRNI